MCTKKKAIAFFDEDGKLVIVTEQNSEERIIESAKGFTSVSQAVNWCKKNNISVDFPTES